MRRHFPVGAEVVVQQGVHFRVWAPDHQAVTLWLEEAENPARSYPLKRVKDGYFEALVSEATVGSLYRFTLDDQAQRLPDPASRFQPQGPFGPSCVVSPHYTWTDRNWHGLSLEGQVIYEMHIGTFTKEGTFAAAMAQLEELAALGVTVLEIMPINDFPGHYGWGYDGVNLYAPSRLYGTPKEAKAFINKAHQLGLAVILDVVYNHLGPAGNYLPQFSTDYFTDHYTTDWGKAINFDHPRVREYFVTNARYWIEEYHFDGLRIDATSCLFCSTEPHILTDISRAAKAAGLGRHVIVIGENEPQNTQLVHPYIEDGYGFDGIWNDDFHHTARVRMTGKREAYYTDYLGSPQEFISALKYGFLYQGQYYSWQKQNRGVADFQLPPASMVVFIENHDQVANSGQGKRLHQLSDPGNFRALTCLLLLGPNTPMLFQGQEFGSSKPFYYFADHGDDLSTLVHKGRKGFLAQFPRLATSEACKAILNPADPLTFTRCKLDFKEREDNAQTYALHRELLALRHQDPIFKQAYQLPYDGAVLGPDTFLLRYFGGEAGDRLLIINFGPDHHFIPCPEPLLAAGPHLAWEILWSSESLRYDGEGTPHIHTPHWKILGHSALVLKTKPVSKSKSKILSLPARE